MTKTVAVDFDGVLHGYSKKWHDGTIYDEPIPGSREAMQSLKDAGFEVVIYSTRCYDRTVKDKEQYHQIEEMSAWLREHQIPFDRIHSEAGKPLCWLFIDDNAYRFKGNWQAELPEIMKLLEPRS